MKKVTLLAVLFCLLAVTRAEANTIYSVFPGYTPTASATPGSEGGLSLVGFESGNTDSLFLGSIASEGFTVRANLSAPGFSLFNSPVISSNGRYVGFTAVSDADGLGYAFRFDTATGLYASRSTVDLGFTGAGVSAVTDDGRLLVATGNQGGALVDFGEGTGNPTITLLPQQFPIGPGSGPAVPIAYNEATGMIGGLSPSALLTSRATIWRPDGSGGYVEFQIPGTEDDGTGVSGGSLITAFSPDGSFAGYMIDGLAFLYDIQQQTSLLVGNGRIGAVSNSGLAFLNTFDELGGPTVFVAGALLSETMPLGEFFSQYIPGLAFQYQAHPLNAVVSVFEQEGLLRILGQGSVGFAQTPDPFTQPNQAAVPEPATIGLLSLGLLGLGAARRRHRTQP